MLLSLQSWEYLECSLQGVLPLTCGGLDYWRKKKGGKDQAHKHTHQHRELPIQHWCFMYYVFNKIVKKDIPSQHLSHPLFFFCSISPRNDRYNLQSASTSSHRAPGWWIHWHWERWQRSRREERKLDLRAFHWKRKGENKSREESREKEKGGEEQPKGHWSMCDPSQRMVSSLDRITSGNKMILPWFVCVSGVCVCVNTNRAAPVWCFYPICNFTSHYTMTKFINNRNLFA